MNSEVLRLSRVTYRDRDNVFLRDYDLEVRSGEIMGLVPLNMYGLPALLDVILYNPQLYYGTVYYMGEVVNSWHEIERSPNPITVVDNVSSLVAGQSVVTNIYELSPNSPYYIQEKLERELQPYLDEIGVNISPRTRVEDLTAFERVVVEILRGVIWGHKLIVLREVSAYIGENKMEQLYGIMDWCRENGISFLYISSHYDEIQAICDRTALMSNGRILMKLDREMTEDLLEEICIKEYQDHEIFRKKNGAGRGRQRGRTGKGRRREWAGFGDPRAGRGDLRQDGHPDLQRRISCDPRARYTDLRGTRTDHLRRQARKLCDDADRRGEDLRSSDDQRGGLSESESGREHGVR